MDSWFLRRYSGVPHISHVCSDTCFSKAAELRVYYMQCEAMMNCDMFDVQNHKRFMISTVIVATLVFATFKAKETFVRGKNVFFFQSSVMFTCFDYI